MGANQGFLRPTGNLARREKTVPSPAPSQWETTPYPSNDLREGLTNSSARPSPAALRSPLTPAKAMKTATPAPVQPIPKQTPLTEEDWQLERPGSLVRREPEKTSPSMAFRLLEDRPVPDQPEETTWEEGTAPVPVTLPQEEIPPLNPNGRWALLRWTTRCFPTCCKATRISWDCWKTRRTGRRTGRTRCPTIRFPNRLQCRFRCSLKAVPGGNGRGSRQERRSC